MTKQLDEERQNPGEGIISVILHFEIGSAILDPKDIYDLYFIEDIYVPVIIGRLQFLDKYGITEIGPFTGNEKITIVFGTEQNKYTLDFEIHKIKNIENLGSAESILNLIELVFVDGMTYFYTQKRFSRAWSNSSISDIVKDICNYMLLEKEFYSFEESREILENFYMPYWTHKEAIQWLIKRASGIYSRNSGYLFYKNLKGLNFVTIDKLLSSTPINGTKFSTKPSTEFYSPYKILGWNISGYNSLALKKIKGGKRLGFNSEKKTFLVKEGKYSDFISKHYLLGRHSLFPDLSDTHVDIRITGDGDELILDNIFYNEFVKRYSKQLTLEILIQGNTDNYCGAIVDVDWPSSLKREDRSNKLLKGYHLIKSITHSFGIRQRPTYIQKLVLIKNAYTLAEVGKVIPLVKATKYNTAGVSGIKEKKIRESSSKGQRTVTSI